MMGTFGALWGIAGVLLLLGSAVYRLSLYAVRALSYDLVWYQWLVLFVFVVFMIYAEGYKGFQQRFSPRTAARARYLRNHPRMVHVFLAPFFCMGYFYATRKRKVTSISLTVGIIMLVLLVRLLSQPWRGIIDIGVVIGLVWGVVSLFIFSIQALVSRQFKYSPEVPEETELDKNA